jgi:hypothetical protein
MHSLQLYMEDIHIVHQVPDREFDNYMQRKANRAATQATISTHAPVQALGSPAAPTMGTHTNKHCPQLYPASAW